MDIKEIKLRRSDLAWSIFKLVKDFTKATGCHVDAIDIVQIDTNTFGGHPQMEYCGIQLTVKVPEE